MKFLILIITCIPFFSFAQEEEPKFTVGGYVKDMATFNFVEKDSALVDNLIHHRLNLAWYPTTHLKGKLEFRNRIFFGDLVNIFPDYGAFIDVNNDVSVDCCIPCNST